MKGNEISNKSLNESAKNYLAKALRVLEVQNYGKGSKRNYLQELTLLFKYYNHKTIETISQTDIENYLLYIKKNHLVGRAKCRSVAQACSFFFKKVYPAAYIVPSNLYPRKEYKLPQVMTEQQVKQLLEAPLSVKEKCAIGLLYGTGMRISELATLKVQDLETNNKRIKIVQGKGNKDRYTLLPMHLLQSLREFYIMQGRPSSYLFTSKQTSKPMHVRSMQLVVNSAMAKAGFAGCNYTAHTLRHSFATHMLNNGTNLHVIKTLLGHSKIEIRYHYNN